MRVFILCTGRSGSAAIIKACEHITNYTADHESLAGQVGVRRFEYADQHIEADNRLSWFLAGLDNAFGDEPIFIHLVRDKDATAKSLMNRWYVRGGIMPSFAEGLFKTPPELLSKTERYKFCEMYYDQVNTNIEYFLRNKTKKMTIQLENIKQDFEQFWQLVGAEGDKNAALSVFDKAHNRSNEIKISLLYSFKLFCLGIWRRFE